MDYFNTYSSLISKSETLRELNTKAPNIRFAFNVSAINERNIRIGIWSYYR